MFCRPAFALRRGGAWSTERDAAGFRPRLAGICCGGLSHLARQGSRSIPHQLRNALRASPFPLIFIIGPWAAKECLAGKVEGLFKGDVGGGDGSLPGRPQRIAI